MTIDELKARLSEAEAKLDSLHDARHAEARKADGLAAKLAISEAELRTARHDLDLAADALAKSEAALKEAPKYSECNCDHGCSCPPNGWRTKDGKLLVDNRLLDEEKRKREEAERANRKLLYKLKYILIAIKIEAYGSRWRTNVVDLAEQYERLADELSAVKAENARLTKDLDSAVLGLGKSRVERIAELEAERDRMREALKMVKALWTTQGEPDYSGDALSVVCSALTPPKPSEKLECRIDHIHGGAGCAKPAPQEAQPAHRAYRVAKTEGSSHCYDCGNTWGAGEKEPPCEKPKPTSEKPLVACCACHGTEGGCPR